MTPPSHALSSDCLHRIDRPIDHVLARSPHATIGAFRCAVQHPQFRDSGPASQYLVVFPRTSVWIRHEGSARFLADPTIATIYNREQRYERFPASAAGDQCDWFGIADDIARDVASAFDPTALDSARPFAVEWTTSSAALYLRQRILHRRARRHAITALELDEAVVAIVAEVLANAYHRAPTPLAYNARALTRRRDLVDAARAELHRTVRQNVSVPDIANAVGTTPFHLCRIFRDATGATLHGYRTTLRMRLALEHLESSDRDGTLSHLALELGYTSHSHLVQATRRQFGRTPTALQQLLR